MAIVTPNPQTTATCQSPWSAPVSTAQATEPVPNSTSRNVPSASPSRAARILRPGRLAGADEGAHQAAARGVEAGQSRPVPLLAGVRGDLAWIVDAGDLDVDLAEAGVGQESAV